MKHWHFLLLAYVLAALIAAVAVAIAPHVIAAREAARQVKCTNQLINRSGARCVPLPQVADPIWDSY